MSDHTPLPVKLSHRNPLLFSYINRELQNVNRFAFQIINLMANEHYQVRFIYTQSMTMNEGGRLSGKSVFTFHALAPSGRLLFSGTSTSIQLAYEDFYARSVEYHSKYEDNDDGNR